MTMNVVLVEFITRMIVVVGTTIIYTWVFFRLCYGCAQTRQTPQPSLHRRRKTM